MSPLYYFDVVLVFCYRIQKIFRMWYEKKLACRMWAREWCRISPLRFLAECRKRRLNQGSFVLLCFVLFAFSKLCLVCVLPVFSICFLSCMFQRIPT